MGLIMVLPIITADTWFDSDVMLNTTANLFIKDINTLPTAAGKPVTMDWAFSNSTASDSVMRSRRNNSEGDNTTC